jgi:L-ascorbate metabolism protein UlaG (beta-lactamase superfamily)
MPVILFFSALLLIAVSVKGFFSLAPQIGGKAKGERLDKMKQSIYYNEGKFQNPVETKLDIPLATILKIAGKMLSNGAKNEPQEIINTIPFNKVKFSEYPEDHVTLTWFGHSSLILKMEGLNFLIDPVFSERASMFSFIGPKRFKYSDYVKVDDLPPIDALIITHDHYDHLDYKTLSSLKGKVNKCFTPLGVGAHLEQWGFSASQIKELGWWESISLNKNLKMTCTPTRHFSGRGFTRFETLWCSWVLSGNHKKIYLGGDSGYYSGFKEIGQKLGPFDLTVIECGAYNENWKDIHILPEETIQAHIDLKGSVLLPIHWGKFNLAMHHWMEPVQRLTAKANEKKVKVIFPEIGEIFSLNEELPSGRWWEQYS